MYVHLETETQKESYAYVENVRVYGGVFLLVITAALLTWKEEGKKEVLRL